MQTSIDLFEIKLFSIRCTSRLEQNFMFACYNLSLSIFVHLQELQFETLHRKWQNVGIIVCSVDVSTVFNSTQNLVDDTDKSIKWKCLRKPKTLHYLPGIRLNVVRDKWMSHLCQQLPKYLQSVQQIPVEMWEQLQQIEWKYKWATIETLALACQRWERWGDVRTFQCGTTRMEMKHLFVNWKPHSVRS